MEVAVVPDILTLRAQLCEVERRANIAEAEAANAKAANADLLARNALLELQIEKLKRDRFGTRSERASRLIDQMELAFEELEASANDAEALAEVAAAKTTSVTAFTRKRPRRELPDHLPRERVIIPAPEACPCCGSDDLSKLGEDVTETLEVIPRQWKVVQTVREKFACRACEAITQPPAPFHVTHSALRNAKRSGGRGFFGPSLLAMLLFEKFGQHQPTNRQRDRYAREGVDLSLTTMIDQMSAAMRTLQPLYLLIEVHALAAERLHADDTTVPVLAKGKVDTARIWTYVRDDRPFGGPAPPIALFYYSRDRRGEHPERHLSTYNGIIQADAYAGYNALLKPERSPAPLRRALCWAHARRHFFELADIAAQAKRRKAMASISPMALAVVQRIDRIFEVERGINGKSADERRDVRADIVTPLVTDLEAWMRDNRVKLSRHDPVAKAMDYMLKDWPAFTAFLTDGRICLTNNAAERALRGIALGRKSWLFAGSDRGGERAAFIYTLIGTAKLNNIDPQAWLADTLARINDIPQSRLHELLPWNWVPSAEPRQIKLAA
jgi:transposase